jgi:hypothetical protein
MPYITTNAPTEDDLPGTVTVANLSASRDHRRGMRIVQPQPDAAISQARAYQQAGFLAVTTESFRVLNVREAQ